MFYSDRETQSEDDEPPQEVEIVGLNQYGLPENIQNDPGDQLRASTFRLKREPYMSMIQRQGFFPKTEPGRDFLSDKPGRDLLEEKRLKRNLLKRFFGEFRDGLLRSRATWAMAPEIFKQFLRKNVLNGKVFKKIITKGRLFDVQHFFFKKTFSQQVFTLAFG